MSILLENPLHHQASIDELQYLANAAKAPEP